MKWIKGRIRTNVVSCRRRRKRRIFILGKNHGGIQKTQCKVIVGNLVINDSVKQEQLVKTVEVHGKVVVKGTSLKNIVSKELYAVDVSGSKGGNGITIEKGEHLNSQGRSIIN